MNDKVWLIAGGFLIVVLLGAISLVYFSPTTFFVGLGLKNTTEKRDKDLVRLNENYGDPEEFTEITVNDIVDGDVLKAEMANAKPFDESIVPLRYVRKDIAYNDAKLVLDEASFKKVDKDPSKRPFRNLYFYKIKNGDKWYTILGQQVKNSDGTSSFLHFLLHTGTEIYSWGRNTFIVEPMIIAPDSYFNIVGDRGFFGDSENYYKKDGKVDKLVDSWLKTGVVPDELQKEVLLMNIRW